MKIQACMNRYKFKPKGTSEYQKVAAIFRDNSLTELECESIEDIKEMILTFGAVKPYSSFSNECWILCLDFDAKSSAANVLQKAKYLNLKPTFAYKTLSETTDSNSYSKIHRFRFIYVLDEKISSTKEYETFTKMLRNEFEESDKSTFNYKRFFFTGKLHDKTPIFFEGDICSKKQMALKIIGNNVISKNVKTIQTKLENFEKNPQLFDLIDVKDFDYLRTGCRSFLDLQNGVSVSHEVKLMLLSNFIHIKNGESLFKSILKNGVNTKDKSKWDVIGKFLKTKNYSNINCNFSCPYHKTCSIYKQSGSIYKFLKTDDFKTLELPTISLEEGRKQFSEQLRHDVMSFDKDAIYVYKVQAGLGKTHELITKYLNYGVFAFPSHSLIKEKIEEYGLSIYHTKDLKEIVTNISDLKKISKSYSLGNVSSARDLIKTFEGGTEYLRSKNVPLSNKMFTTQEKTLNCKFDENCHIVFYDEDPTGSYNFKYVKYSKDSLLKDFKELINVGLITDDELKILNKFVSHISKFHNVPKQVNTKTIDLNLINEIGDRIISYQKNNALALKQNISSFLKANTYSKNSYSYIREFPKGKSIFIMSATPDIKMIERVAAESGRTVIVRKFEDVGRVGKIKQVVVNSSKNAIKKDVQFKLNEMTKNNVTITYKENSKDFNVNDKFVPYCGNSFGYNTLKGLNTNVCHTYQCPPEVYFHKHATIYNKPICDSTMSYQYINWNNKEFRFFSYNDPKLREIVLTHIDSEMIQSIERSRTLTEDCESTIFSDFICSIVKIENCEFI